jgi:uncharacterized PurR-regulated membrane protein YhhQ (DUF165 family)
MLEQKKHRLFIVLSGIFLTNAIIAEMIGVKIFSGEGTLGLAPAHLTILGFTMDFNLTAGAVIWPVVFITSDLINEYFGMRKITGSKMLWLRATGSTLVSQLIDSFVVLYIAFAGIFSNSQIVAIGLTNYLYKFAVAILLTPAIYGGHYLIDRYLGKENAKTLSEEAAAGSHSFL